VVPIDDVTLSDRCCPGERARNRLIGTDVSCMSIKARGRQIWMIGVLSPFWPIVVRDHTGLHTVSRDDPVVRSP
jgi:hypothetical protein